MVSDLTGSESAAATTSAMLQQYWGFDSLRPLQEQAIDAGLSQRDSLVVMPTGGGKSLCYQLPPLIADRLDIVVSPLISLMKDQVDGLQQAGYPAAGIHSHLSPNERRNISHQMQRGELRLVFVSPERLMTAEFLEFLGRLEISTFAIDEAHCISHWGHDFRPEYRRLSELKQRFPNVSLHAFTATATPRVQRDIIDQLQLHQPQVLVGDCDRANLVYRILPRTDVYRQVIGVLRRHQNEAVIAYCISRKETEALATVLQANGFNARAYHAGMDGSHRREIQDAFAADELDIVVATVAFGMGIDRSNVRCVIHTAMPKSVEHYQQETGRAGRDGLEAECVLLYSAADAIRWEKLIHLSAAETDDPAAVIEPQMELLNHMQRLCSNVACRHAALSQYFGQQYSKTDCEACDVCLDEVDTLSDSTTVAQKILSCVARLEQRFGVGHVVDVLRGANTQQVRKFGHDSLSTWGLLEEFDERTLRNLTYQLVDQELLGRTGGDRPILKLTQQSLEVLRGDRQVKLHDPQVKKLKATKTAEDAWEGVDRALFERLRELRKEIARERGVPAFVIFGDSTLRGLARVRPVELSQMRHVEGVGEHKLADLGERFVAAIAEYCDAANVDTGNVDADPSPEIVLPKRRQPNPARDKAERMFAQQRPVEEIAAATGRAVSTVLGYLEEFVEETKPATIEPWVDDETVERIRAAAMDVEDDRLRPIYEQLEGDVPYEQIRIVVAHLKATAMREQPADAQAAEERS